MKLLHPLSIMAYSIILVVFACVVSSRTKQEYRPMRSVKFCIDQAKHAYYGAKHAHPTVQLLRNVSALTYIAAARTMAPNTNTILKATKTDPSELHNSLVAASKPLLKRAGVSQDMFKAVVA
ncbi:hypothetical protein OAM67_00185 [bacterium]|nr:hypothetical protein [bacterium]